MAQGLDVDGMIVKQIQHAFPDVLVIYRFGSTVAGDGCLGSDVDIAVYAGCPLDVHQLWLAAQGLAENLGQDVDLIDLAQASTVMAMQVLSKGRRVFSTEQPGVDAFESRVFSDYARLNEERAGILQDIQVRGSVYG